MNAVWRVAERDIALATEQRMQQELASMKVQSDHLSALLGTVSKLEASVGAKADAGTSV